MKMLIKLSIAALVIGIQTTALCDTNYEDLAAKGYRWADIDGPYASKIEADAQRLSKEMTPGRAHKPLPESSLREGAQK